MSSTLFYHARQGEQPSLPPPAKSSVPKEMTLPPPVLVACGLSWVGDALVVTTWLLLRADERSRDVSPDGYSERSRLGKNNFSVRYVAYLAAANLVTSSIGIINGTVSRRASEGLCVALGSTMWWSLWASWLWTAAIAQAFYHYFSHPAGFADGEVTRELWAHGVCWGGGLALVGVVYATGNRFGASESDNDSDACTLVTPPADDVFATQAANVLVLGLLMLVLIANIWAFVGVHLVLERSRRLAHSLLLDQVWKASCKGTSCKGTSCGGLCRCLLIASFWPPLACELRHNGLLRAPGRLSDQQQQEQLHSPAAAYDEHIDYTAPRADDYAPAPQASTAPMSATSSSGLMGAAPLAPPPRRPLPTRRRVALWPTFAAYVGVFLLSQVIATERHRVPSFTTQNGR